MRYSVAISFVVSFLSARRAVKRMHYFLQSPTTCFGMRKTRSASNTTSFFSPKNVVGQAPVNTHGLNCRMEPVAGLQRKKVITPLYCRAERDSLFPIT